MGFSRSAPAPAPAPVVKAPEVTKETPQAIQKRRADAEGRTVAENTGDLGDGGRATKKLLGA